MESKNKKEIVEHIIDQLKSVDELPYREGAWENFNIQPAPSIGKKKHPYYWAASVAAILLAGIFILKYLPDNKIQHGNSLSNIQVEHKKNKVIIDSDKKISPPDESIFQKDGPIDILDENDTFSQLSLVDTKDKTILNLANSNSQNIILSELIPSTNLKRVNLLNQKPNIKFDIQENYIAANDPENQALAYQENGNDVSYGKNNLKLKQRKFKFDERFDLGVFVSPSTTNENFNLGAGLLLSYNINKNLSVRTGLAFNRYEVGSMKDPILNSETQVYASNESVEKISADGLTQLSMNKALVIPNINAITGNVQAFEVPLELTLKFSKGLYASSGLVYAIVLDQNRYAHYIENANSQLFTDGLPENESEMQSAIKQVSKSIKTDEENIKTNGFGGFVNFSLGKQMKVKKSFSVSVEPFLKLPVGNFKQADMNYTNGGIRIITNF